MVIKRTVETYVPPITTKVIDFKAMYQCMKYLQQLGNNFNMAYVNITLDFGASINTQKLLSNYSVSFQSVVIHLGELHSIRENFMV